MGINRFTCCAFLFWITHCGSLVRLSSLYHSPPSHMSPGLPAPREHHMVAGTSGEAHSSLESLTRSNRTCGLTADCEEEGRKCENGGICYVNQSSCKSMCLCTGYHTGDRCEQRSNKSKHVSLFSNINIDPKRKYMQNQTSEDNSDPMKPVRKPQGAITCETPNRTSNKCPSRFPCEHGICKVDGEDSHVGKSTPIPRLKCVCDPGWSGPYCDHCCPLNCGNGTCVHENGSTSCSCQWGYDGEFCDAYDPTLLESTESESPVATMVVIVSVIMSIVVCGVAVLVICLVWKHRMPLILKFIDRLQRRSDKYDDGEYVFDAFISYSSCVRSKFTPTSSQTMDDKFVMNTLFPALEKMGYRVCLHYRDFIPGNAIIDNILQAVQLSKRTLLVISPDFADSEWTRFEYQVAQHEMLKLRHRIVPIVYRDVSHIPNLDRNLRYILASVTYVTWPKSDCQSELDLFWKSLKQSLPKTPIGRTTTSGPTELESRPQTQCNIIEKDSWVNDTL